MEIQVCLPGLHISLGVFDRLWTLLEGACTELDLLLAEHISVGCMGSSYNEYVTALRKGEQLRSSLHQEEQRATMMEQLVTYFSLSIARASPSKLSERKLQRPGLVLLLW